MYKKPDKFDPSKSLRVLNWTGKVWEHTYLSEYHYLEKGNPRVGNKEVTLVMNPGGVITATEGVAHYLATRMAEWSYGKTSANIAIAPDRGERILKALPDLSGEPTRNEPIIEEISKEALSEEAPVEKPKKKGGRKKKVEDEFAGLNEEE